MQKNQELQTLKGFRDFLPAEALLREKVRSIIQNSFKRFAFVPFETPTLEYASLLLGKYGEEADKLLYTFTDRGGRQLGLRYDQTVPSARVLANYQNQLPKYLRRYQIQTVFRADKPQRGRYREFVQCDADIFGSRSTLADAEILALFYNIFQDLGLSNIQIEYNDRQLLIDNLAEFANDQVSVLSIVQSIDKLDKFKPEIIELELVQKGLKDQKIEQILSKLNNIEKSAKLLDIEQKTLDLGVPQSMLRFNPKLARGLDYYTGLIFEAKTADFATNNSLGGGGRYDNLIKELAGLTMPAVGFGLGFDRIVELIKEKNLIQTNDATQVLVAFFDQDKYQQTAIKLIKELRAAGINSEIYLEKDKINKQFKLAQDKNIPWVAVIGEEEFNKGLISLKNMATGQQDQLEIKQVIDKIQA
ncbi:histidine--tRNA ligase [Candidatus Woesebacteria bacterium]|nr:histidine--tRNA ligase [Candidatus Woesebacteria bacterium]HNV45111.1 histidine--tRNA ligase [Candidatus Woesebacteria bacterium]HOC07585.1 histidine--tRNA ligase [Candidatus Woesebacteria bacterium]HOI05421.1 histidine--tRNA ligase [Candidatus Woesebacteria bacterium]HPA62209.1 histidine--tRNA ligase [Candidatus Woesebacteria bacterium]